MMDIWRNVVAGVIGIVASHGDDKIRQIHPVPGQAGQGMAKRAGDVPGAVARVGQSDPRVDGRLHQGEGVAAWPARDGGDASTCRLVPEVRKEHQLERTSLNTKMMRVYLWVTEEPEDVSIL